VRRVRSAGAAAGGFALCGALLSGCPAPGAPSEAPPGEVPATLGGDRPAAFVVPAEHDGVTPLPLVLLLGGYDYLSADLDVWIGVRDRVDELGFALVMPDGLVDSAGSPYWNATDTCCDFDGSGVDDAGYLRGLVAEAQDVVPVDGARVVVVGHSNGGFMGYRLACEEQAPVTALVSIAGSGWLDADDCVAERPVSVLQVHGLDDDVMPFDGDGDAPGALTMLQRWAGRNGCGGALQAEGLRDYADDGVADETAVSSYGGCAGQDVELWAMEGTDHYPAFRPEFARDALGWALGRPRE